MVALPAYLGPSLAEDAASEEPLDMLGLSTIVSVPAVEEDEQGNELLVGLECSVLLLDADDGLAERMVPYDPVTDIDVISFVPGSSQLVPQPEALQRSATEWVEGEASEKLGYYTAVEEVPADSAAPNTPAPKRQATAKKRVTVSQLSEQVAALTGVLPSLVEQMKGLVERQNQLEKAAPGPQLEKAAPAALPAKAPVPVHQQPFPASRCPGSRFPRHFGKDPSCPFQGRPGSGSPVSACSPCRKADSSSNRRRLCLRRLIPCQSADSARGGLITPRLPPGGPRRVLRLGELLDFGEREGLGKEGAPPAGPSCRHFDLFLAGLPRSPPTPPSPGLSKSMLFCAFFLPCLLVCSCLLSYLLLALPQHTSSRYPELA